MARAKAYLHPKFHLDPSNRLATVHQRHRQDRQTGQQTNSIRRTVLQTVAQKCVHRKCSGIKGSMIKVSKFLYVEAVDQRASVDRTSMDIGNSASLELVGMFCYLRDMFSIDGDADAAVEASVRKGWNKFRQLVLLLINKDVSLITRLMTIGDVTKCRSVQKTAKIVFFRRHRTTEYTNQDEIWHVSVDRGSAIAHQIWPSSVKGGRYRSPPKCQNLPKILVFGHRKPSQ